MSRFTELMPPELPPLDQAMELRPCPFCGGRAEMKDLGNADFTIGCIDETCEVYAVAGPFNTAAEAVAVWNTRKGWKL